MLRITELRLPLDHAEDALRPAIVARLQLADAAELLDFHVFRRGYDARKKTAIVLTYTIDCTLRDEDGAIVLVDHSRHGTFVNGERVAGRARLRAGDRLRIGDPGVELALIAVGAGHGAPQG